MTAQRVVVKVEAGAGPVARQECGAAGPRYDGKPRRWRHLDTKQFTTWIEADVPRVECASHGVPRQIRIPWAEPGSQFTALFERLAIDLVRECSVTGAGRLRRITWDEAWGIQGRPVKRGLARRGAEVVPHVGVDEKALAKRHRYLAIVADLDRMTPTQPTGITAVAMDRPGTILLSRGSW